MCVAGETGVRGGINQARRGKLQRKEQGGPSVHSKESELHPVDPGIDGPALQIPPRSLICCYVP